MNKTVIIEGALESEIYFLLKSIKTQKVIKNNYVFYEGEINDYKVVISKTKMGEISSAIATTIAIKEYNPLCILNIGTAGALHKDLEVNDIIVGTNVYYISDFSTKEDKEIEEINPWKNSGYKTIDNEVISYKSDDKLIDFLKSSNSIKEFNVHFGTICSGDVWTKDIDKIKEYNSKYNGLCEAMEVSGLYLAANNFDVPAVSIRVISNNEIRGVEYDPNSGLVVQKLALKLIDEIIDKFNR